MTDDKLAPFRGHSDPLAIVDQTDLDYETRLTLLQDWRAALADADAPQAHHDLLAGAIQALEMGAEIQGDESPEAPDARGYGVQKTE